jgi:hypothetical protein
MGQELGTYVKLMLGGLKWYPMLALLPVYPKTPKCTVVDPDLTSRNEIFSHVGDETETCFKEHVNN